MDKFSPIKGRILQYLEYKGIAKTEFCAKTNISYANMKGKSLFSEIGGSQLYEILSIYKDLSPDWLIMGIGDMLRSKSPNGNIEITEYKTRLCDSKRTDTVPLYSVDAFCGIVTMFDDVQTLTPVDYITIPNLPLADGAVHVVGDSMYPILKAGDIVIYKTLNDKTNILWGEMYLLSFVVEGDSFTTVKYVQKSEENGMVRLVSQNQHHQPKDIPFDSIRFAALVKASVRINSME